MTRSAATNGAAATESGDGRSRLYCGLDFGTSSARLALVDDDGRLVRSHARGYEAPDSKTGMTAPWLRAMWELLEALDEDERGRMDAVAVDQEATDRVSPLDTRVLQEEPPLSEYSTRKKSPEASSPVSR